MGEGHVELSNIWAQHLARLPETGMGYQVVDIYLKDGRVEKNLIVIASQKITGRAVPESNVRPEPVTLTFEVEDIDTIILSIHRFGQILQADEYNEHDALVWDLQNKVGFPVYIKHQRFKFGDLVLFELNEQKTTVINLLPISRLPTGIKPFSHRI